MNKTIPSISPNVTDFQYQELTQFKNDIDTKQFGPKFQPYTASKSNVMLYRTIFLGIGAIYLIIATVLFMKSLTWTCSLIFGSCFIVKTLLCSFCIFSAIASITIGFLIKTEKEALLRHFRNYKGKIKSAYERKLVKFGLSRYFSFGKEYRKYLTLKQYYDEFMERLHEEKDESLHILERIAKSEDIDGPTREKLFNQAIMEFKRKTENMVESFIESNPSKLIENHA